MTITTWHEYSPIPVREFDWGARIEDDELRGRKRHHRGE